MMRAFVPGVRKGVLSMIFGTALLVALTACSDKNRVPSDLLQPEEMEKVMWDMILADRYATMHFHMDSVKRKDIKTETFKLYEQVFEIHHISREKFIESYRFYLSRPDLGKMMFDSVATRADRRRNEAMQQEARAAQIKDSIANKRVSDSVNAKLKTDSLLKVLKKDPVSNKSKIDSLSEILRKDSILNKSKLDSLAAIRKKDSLINKMRRDSISFQRRKDSILNKRKFLRNPKTQ